MDNFHHNDEAVRQFFFDLKYPDGYICPECGNRKCHYLKNRKVFQCTHCCHQESVLANTAFHGAKFDLFKILFAIYLFVSSQSGISGTQLAYELEVNVKTACSLLRTLRAIADIENTKELLSGYIDIDAAYLGGIDRGNKRGRGSNKQTVLVAQELEKGKYPRQSVYDAI
ncbi:transposase [Amedibacterium intestinale]|uniref:transposase n=1 Tax=Amedibacterium intestinale TaxID=2583452 RepID=UPI000E4A3B98|nr:transposase [Amedibacterium intestinale]RHO29393.1 hypothetical protein DW208_07500 [Erysipelotrichaceae bacterium AM17-60]